MAEGNLVVMCARGTEEQAEVIAVCSTWVWSMGGRARAGGEEDGCEVAGTGCD